MTTTIDSRGAPRDSSCIFCRIVAGEIPAHRLYEDERVLAFLDVEPLARGHTLVIPKDHYATLHAVPSELAAACAGVVPRLARAVLSAVGDAGGAWNLLQNNGKAAQQSVAHVHFHIIPRKAGDGLGYRWNAGKLDADDAKDLLGRIRDTDLT